MENFQPLRAARQYLFGPSRQFLRLCWISTRIIQQSMVTSPDYHGLSHRNHIFCGQFQDNDVNCKVVKMESYPL